ncbi:MAG: hypothetical protein ACYC3I_10080 [Gemmataceae bacterium]
MEEDDVESVRPKPKLGSLAQKARGGKLKQARGILFFVGGLTLIVQIGLLVVELNDANVPPLLAVAFHGLFILVGALFIIFGALIYHFPVPITIISLVVYILVSLIDLGLAALTEPARMASGIFWKIFFIVALASSIRTAVAYEKERREQDEYRFGA